MQGLTIPKVILLSIMLILTFLLTIIDVVIENKKGGYKMKKIFHTKLNTEILAKSFVKNTVVICRSVAASALSAYAF